MSTAASKTSKCPSILLVDDNKMGLSARKNVLEESGYSVSAFSTAGEALECFEGGEFDLVVTDFRMPKMNGIELIAQVRERTPAMPIIMLSGLADTLGLNATSTGADVVIQKSNQEVPTLLRAVTRLLTRKAPKKPAGTVAGSASTVRRKLM